MIMTDGHLNLSPRPSPLSIRSRLPALSFYFLSGRLPQSQELGAERGPLRHEVRLRARGGGHALEPGVPVQPRQTGGEFQST